MKASSSRDDGGSHRRGRASAGEGGVEGGRKERVDVGKSGKLPAENVIGEGRSKSAVAPSNSEGGDIVLEGERGPVHQALIHMMVGSAVKEAALRGGGFDEIAKAGRVAGERPNHNFKAMVGGEAEVVRLGERPRERQSMRGVTDSFEATLDGDDDTVNAVMYKEVEARRGRGVGGGGDKRGGSRRQLEGKGRRRRRTDRQEGAGGGTSAERLRLTAARKGAKVEEVHQAQRVWRVKGGSDGIKVGIERVVSEAQVGREGGGQALSDTVDNRAKSRDLDLVDQGLGQVDSLTHSLEAGAEAATLRGLAKE